MKQALLLIGLCLFSLASYSQWTPDWGAIQETMSRKQQQYDNGYSQLQRAYSDLIDLKLINKENSRALENYKSNVTKGVQNVEKVDFGIQANVASYLKFINSYLDNTSIKAEIDLLNKISSEVMNLKARDPGSFTSTDRFKELKAVFNELEVCNPANIKDIGWKHGIL